MKRGPSPTTTQPKTGGRPGGALSRGHRSAGKPAQGIAELASPVLGPIQGPERSGGAPGQPSAGVSRSPSLSEEISGTMTHSSVKRKVTTQGNLFPESGKTLKTQGGGKRLRKSTDKDTTRRTAARKSTERPRRTAGRGERPPSCRGNRGFSSPGPV